MRAAFHTLGCKVNQYETEAIKEAFVSRGAEIVSEDESADIYVINTCTVTNIADRKSRQFIRRAKRMDPEAIVVVTGCYAQVSAEEVAAMPEVDLVIGNALKTEIADRAIALYNKDKAASAVDEAGEETEERDARFHVLSYDDLTAYEDMGIVTSDESSMTRAYIKIEEGCNRFCSYCLIPYARGRVRSRAPEQVTAEAKALVEKGYKEIVLTGINTALYGTEPGFDYIRGADEEGLSGLETIIKRIDALEGDFRIRLSSLEPTVVDKDDILKLLGYSKLCHHLHLSIQSGSDKVLEAMNRHYTRDDYLEIVKALRRFDPHYGITTDIIVGFPGETDEDFADTLDVVKKAGFGKVHVFRYSPRKGTGGESLPDAVPGEVKSDRASRLEAEAEVSAAAFNAGLLGSVRRVLIEEERDGYAEGYTDNYVKIYIKNVSEDGCGNGDGITAAKPRPGEFCDARLIEAYRDGILASPEKNGD